MDVGKFIAQLASDIGLTPACLLACIIIYVMYRLLESMGKRMVEKDHIIERQADNYVAAIQENTATLTELKTLFSVFMSRRDHNA